MRRDRPYHHDVGVSAGLPGQVRRYLVIGVDRENRPYCSFYGDDLRGSPLTLEREGIMHSYSCSYNSATRERILIRDDMVIAKDIVTGGFSAPNSPLVIGRRADTMDGLDGVIASVRYWPSVVTTTGIFVDPLSLAAIQFPGIHPGQQPFVCNSAASCPSIVHIGEDSHDSGYLQFNKGNSLSLPMPANTNAFTASVWMNLQELNVAAANGSILSRLNADGTGFVMRMAGGNLWCGKLRASEGSIAYQAMASVGYTELSSGWHMYSCTVSNSRMELYIDGVKKAEAAIPEAVYGSSIVVGQVPGVPIDDCTYMTFCNWLTYPVDDVYVYQEALSAQRITALYRETSRILPVPTDIPNPLITATFTTVRTATTTFTRTPTQYTRTRIPATLTMTVPPTETNTRSATLTSTHTSTRTFTQTVTSSPTITPTRPTSTVYMSPTKSSTRTRTALAITRTIMARRSPTYAVLTMTAGALYGTQTETALPLTQTAVVVGPPTKTATAYPVPSTQTPLPAGYPIP